MATEISKATSCARQWNEGDRGRAEAGDSQTRSAPSTQCLRSPSCQAREGVPLDCTIFTTLAVSGTLVLGSKLAPSRAFSRVDLPLHSRTSVSV